MANKKVNNKIFKLGLDWHGVIDKYPKIFKMLSRLILLSGGEVHIITGHSWDNKFKRKLKKIWGTSDWNYKFSITDYLTDKGLPFEIGADSGKYFELSKWNSAKAIYCKKHNIDLMIDDSEEYGKHFKNIPYLLLK